MAYCGHYEHMMLYVLLLALLPSGSKQGPRAGLFALCDSSHSEQKQRLDYVLSWVPILTRYLALEKLNLPHPPNPN